MMAMVDIAMNDSLRPVSISDIAQRQEIDPGYLEQIFMKLRSSGLVASFRGAGGGYRLARGASEITVADVMNSVEEDLKSVRCDAKTGGCLRNNAKCSTHHLWADLDRQIIEYLSKVTIDMVCNINLAEDHDIPRP